MSSKTIYGDSPFYKFFNKFYETTKDTVNQNSIGNENELCCTKFLEDLLKKSIAYLPLWSAVLPSYDIDPDEVYFRPNNGMVEGYFGQLKSGITDNKSIGKLGNIKIARYVRFMRNKIETDAKIIRVQLPQKHPQRKSRKMVAESALAYSQEQWKNRSKSSTSIMFSNENLTKELGMTLMKIA